MGTHTGQTNHFFRINLYYLCTIYIQYILWCKKIQDVFRVSQSDGLWSAVQTGSSWNHQRWTDDTVKSISIPWTSSVFPLINIQQRNASLLLKHFLCARKKNILHERRVMFCFVFFREVTLICPAWSNSYSYSFQGRDIAKGNNIHTRYPIRGKYTGGERLRLAVRALFWMNYQPYSPLPMSKQIEHTVHKRALCSTQTCRNYMLQCNKSFPELRESKALQNRGRHTPRWRYLLTQVQQHKDEAWEKYDCRQDMVSDFLD